MKALSKAYQMVVDRVGKVGSLALSRNIIAKDHPSTRDMHDRYSVHMPSGGPSIDRDDMRCTQRVEVWIVRAVRHTNHVDALKDALDTEVAIVSSLQSRDWHALPIDIVTYQSSARTIHTDGDHYKIGLVFDVRVWYDPEDT